MNCCRWAFPEENDSVKKIPQLDTPPAYIRSNLMVRSFRLHTLLHFDTRARCI